MRCCVLCLFCLLLWGWGRTRSEQRRALNPMLKKKALIASGIAAILWLGSICDRIWLAEL